ncbi:superoxide dismutase family protein [Marinobacter sp. OP 3.4]|uniref:superoxide dismutase family protein n=1 Tax=Marinobacter sp. OP 3.4 TaxID=3076501 RepID=UPI002E210C3E
MSKQRLQRGLIAIALCALIYPWAQAVAHERTTDRETDSRVTDAGLPPESIEMTRVSSTTGDSIGTIRVTQLAEGLLFEPALEELSPGLHGFHVHEGDQCAPTRERDNDSAAPSVEPAGEAGTHWDPGLKGNHEGPWGMGHLGDLPNLYVDPDGVATLPVYAPRLTLRDISERALVVHANRDNYTDDPDGMGGSGNTVACGVLKQ